MFFKNKKNKIHRISVLLLVLSLKLHEAKSSFGELTTLENIYSKCDYTINPCSSPDDSNRICTIESLDYNRNFYSCLLYTSPSPRD